MSLRIKDVANRAGVSVATVSRVLNNSTSVKPETYERVLEVIKEVQYKPNAIARSLKVKNTRTIGIMIPDISSHFFPEVVRGIEDIANIHSYNIILCNTDLNRDKEHNYLEVLTEKQVDGIIFMSNIINQELGERLQQLKVPVILISTDFQGLPAVTIDNIAASRDMIEYLIRQGHRRIGMISGKENDPIAGASRLEGYKAALRGAGIKLDPEMIVEGDYRFQKGYEGGKMLLSHANPPTAIFAASDEMAFGVIKAASELKLSIPKDIAVAGFDNIDMADKIVPSLTTIAQPMYEMGATGMRLLTKILDGEETSKGRKVVLDYTLIERETC